MQDVMTCFTIFQTEGLKASTVTTCGLKSVPGYLASLWKQPAFTWGVKQG